MRSNWGKTGEYNDAQMVQHNEHVIAIRDTQTVQALQRRLVNARRMLVVGNGGIATELVHYVRNIECVWVVKHASISATFVDAGAAEFFLAHMYNDAVPTSDGCEENIVIRKRMTYTHEAGSSASCSTAADAPMGSALGPDWAEAVPMLGAAATHKRHLHIVYSCELVECLSQSQLCERHMVECVLPPPFKQPVDGDTADWPVYGMLSNGQVIGCDVIVSAVGVVPDGDIWVARADAPMEVSPVDGGLLVDEQMCTNIECVHAAGDVCTPRWSAAPAWMLMRLWTQARQMGAYAARCMHVAVTQHTRMQLDICFELFTHCTRFFDYKVVLLGRYNAQGLTDAEHVHTLLRVHKASPEKGGEYVKIVIYHDRVIGAILIGETDLDETIENLILNATDVGNIKDDLLNPTVDIEDYFD